MSSAAVVGDGVSVVNASRRNGNLKVINGKGPHYFLKQETRGSPPRRRKFATVAYEAAVYELLATVYSGRAGFHALPRYYAFDSAEQVLIIEAFLESTTLRDHCLRRGRFPSTIARLLAAALAECHNTSPLERTHVTKSLRAPEKPPWVFFLPVPDQWVYLHSSLASLDLIKIIQESDQLCKSFEACRGQWTNETFIHGDLKWDNCLICAEAPRPEAELKIVDWELARLGDPCWDVGTVFSEYLTLWLSSIPISNDHPPDQFLSLALFPLHRMQPALRAFWSVYRRRMRISAAEEEAWLLRAVSFAGVRLVQTAYEQSQVEASVGARAVSLLQLCSNILARPMEAAVQLLGLPLPGRRHEHV